MSVIQKSYKMLSSVEHILKRSFYCTKMYSKCFSNFSCNSSRHQCLLKRRHVLLAVNNSYVRFYSNVRDIVDNEQLKEYFDYLSKCRERGKSNDEDLNQILQQNSINKLIENRVQLLDNIKSLKELVSEEKDMKQVAEEEEQIYKEKLENIESTLLELIADKMIKSSCQDITFEINAGVGGQEAMLFVKDLLEMYQKYFDYLNYDYEIIELNEVDLGGIRKVILTVSGENALEILRHESGVHRVQRIPTTERTGRIHTSVVSIAVLPQPSEVEIIINKEDLKIDTKRASGPGGQSVNKTDSAVRLTHLPTGKVIECQTERSQGQNMKIAMLKLRMQLYQEQLNSNISNSSKLRKAQMGMKNRNEKIRTYNYNQNRVTDHRLTENGTVYNLRGFFEGGKELKNFQEKLQVEYKKSVLLDAVNSINKR